MQHVLIGLCSAALLLITGCTSKHLEIFPDLSNPGLTDQKIAPEKLYDDIDAFIAGVTERHPAYSRYADISQIHQQAARIKAGLIRPLTRVEFFREVGTLSHYFNDGHTFLLWPYQEYQALKEEGALMFPFALDVFPSGIFVKYDYHANGQTLRKGTRLLRINDVNVETIFSHAQQFVGGETELLRKHVVAARFPMMLWAVYGFVDRFDLDVQTSDNIHQISIRPDDNWQPASQPDIGSDFAYRVLSKDTGYLKVATFDVSPDWFEDFVDATFLQIRQQGIKTLIIDIRENGGGNTDTASYLARHLADQPFRMISSLRERLNTDNRGLFNYRGEVGDMLQEEWGEWLDPVDDSRRFSGNAYVLISPLTYSSAIVFATAVKDNAMATLVGRQTGGYANQTAQGNLFNLPHSELRAYVATRLLVRPDGSTEVSGVKPDIRVTITSEQISAGTDADIQAAVEHAAGITARQ
ncbi:S41 family peptidase [Alteromonas sp. CYL-A6]|uniref:S41 family peptidase n=1 Tax=Alteromonas nitratireducens TaxID=3390813 RepID=UPI0034AA3A13